MIGVAALVVIIWMMVAKPSRDGASHKPVELAGAMEPLQLERTGVLKAQL